ncbi:MAG: glucuronate isomerase [Puniceicoccales bacterium]|jgi:glucuronate isomerase|nr:glucuronate isomerase [Puniceicoccales bacterium]
MAFLDSNFILSTPLAQSLYHEVAATKGIIDFHCHLSPQEIAGDRRFANLHEVWLEGDHYKWRAMRANGIPEKYITGDATPWEKFQAWAATVPQTLRNPLYLWTHLELRRYFGIETLLDETSAKKIWDEANAKLADPALSARGILKKFAVEVVCTTDDPADPLDAHGQIRREQLEAGVGSGGGVGGDGGGADGGGGGGGGGGGFTTKVLPTFRPDKALTVGVPAAFNAWADKLAATANVDTASFGGFLAALAKRHADFRLAGGRLSDHGLERCFAADCTEAQATAIFDAVRSGKTPDAAEQEQFGAYMMLFFGELDAAAGWTKQLHLGPIRNTNADLLRRVGADAGCDSVGDFPQARALAWYLGKLAERDALPKTILYNINPADNYVFATMAGNFQDGVTAGKIQHGSGWWFLDQEEGMRGQLNALSNLGLLSRFVGMLTDSRSFLSYPRHEYFRRILCDLLATDVATGRLPDRRDYLDRLVADVSHDNAARYFGF